MPRSPVAAALVCCASLLVSHLASQNPRDVQVIGAATIGRAVNIRLIAPQQSVTDQDRYYLMLSPHTDAVTQFPPVTQVFGDFKLDRNLFLFVLIAGITKTQIDLPATIPNDTSIVGVSVDLQYGDQSFKNNRIDLSDEAVITIMAAPTSGGGVGTSLIAQGGLLYYKGFAIESVDNTNVANPKVLNTQFNYGREVQGSMGDRGFVQGALWQGYPASIDGTHNADIEIFAGGKYMWDGRNESHGFSPIVLPDGRKFAVVRDAKKVTEFLAVVLDPSKGTVTEIAGSRAGNLSGVNNVYTNFKGLPIFNSTKYPNVVALFRDNDAASTGHQDQVFLLRLDNSKWPVTANKLPGEGTPVLDVSYRDSNGKIPVGWNVHEFGIYNVNDGVIFRVWGTPSTSNWDYWWIPFDGSAAAKHFPSPKNGTNNAIWWLYGFTYRTSRDGKNLCVPSGSNQPDPFAENDIHGFYNISTANMAKGSAGPFNLTGFSTPTPVRPFFGKDRQTSYPSASTPLTFYLDYSPDGELIAFISGTDKSTPPNVLYITKANGSTAGKLVPVKTGTGGLPAPPSGGGYVYMSHLHWRNSNELVVFAGAGSTVAVAQTLMDLYHVKLDSTNPHDGSKATVTKMTSVGNIDVRWSLVLPSIRQTETLFFGRAYDGSAQTTALELVAYEPSTNRLFSLTGTEFTTGAPSMELNQSTEKVEFRQRPGSPEIFYVGRPRNTATNNNVLDMNVYKFNSSLLTPVSQAVTNYTGSGAVSSALNIHSLVVLSDGSVAYVAVKGLPSATNKEVVTFWKAGASSPIAIGRFARGSQVMPGSLYAQEKIGGANNAHGIYWVQGDLGTQTGYKSVIVENTRAYFARTDDMLKGHPIQLTGTPSSANDTGFVQFLGVNATNK